MAYFQTTGHYVSDHRNPQEEHDGADSHRELAPVRAQLLRPVVDDPRDEGLDEAEAAVDSQELETHS